jgi:protein gp37
MLQFVKIAGCEGFHCYEMELLDRLQALGLDLLGANHTTALMQPMYSVVLVAGTTY